MPQRNRHEVRLKQQAHDHHRRAHQHNAKHAPSPEPPGLRGINPVACLTPGSPLELALRLPDGRVGTVPLPQPEQEVDIPLRLDRGVQRLELLAASPEGSPKTLVAILEDLRVE